MKKTFLFLILLFAFNFSLSFAQTQKAIDAKNAAIFEEKFNADDFNGIFDLFSQEMRDALSRNETNEFLTKLKSQAGQIKSREYIRYARGSFASYKATFEKGIFSLNISTDKNAEINGLYIEPFTAEDQPIMERNRTKLILPFFKNWSVVWGGDIEELNYHVESKAQKNAFDFIITGENKKSYKTDGKTNEDYYAFGKSIIAPCYGEIVLVVDGIEDNAPGELNPMYVPGNTVILKTTNEEYLFFAHFKQNSIKVTQGQKVKQGEMLGFCGNSGNSTEPHLHFHIQNVKDINVATGVKCYFENILVNRNMRHDYSPIRGEIVENAE